MAEYKDIFSPKTLDTLKRKSKETFNKALKGRNPYQMSSDAHVLIDELIQAEREYRDELEMIAVQIIKEAYPIVEYAGVCIDAKLGDSVPTFGSEMQTDPSVSKDCEIVIQARGVIFPVLMHEIAKGLYEITPEKRRIINGITQGGSIKGTFSYNMYREYLDAIDPNLVEKYNQVMIDTFGGYHDDAKVARMLNAVQKYGDQIQGVGLSNIYMPKHKAEDSEKNAFAVGKVDSLKNEFDDIINGEALYEAITNLYTDSKFDDPRIRDYFLGDLYKLEPYETFRSFVENAVNNELTPLQKKWAMQTMEEIESDLKADDAGVDIEDSEDLFEIKRLQKLANILND